MRTNSFILKIEKPCSENWNSMKVNSVGKFCSSCEKNVIDFSKCSDDELIRILEKIDGKVCGRLSKSQLERIYTVTKNKKVSPHLNKILAGLFALGMLKSNESVAQNNSIAKIETVGNYSAGLETERIDKTEDVIASIDSSKNMIHGKVIDAFSKKPISYFRVGIKNTNIISMTDTAGNFQIYVPDSLMHDSITLQYLQVGYEMTETKIALKNISSGIIVSLVAQEEIMMQGEMIYEPPVKKKKGKK